jgi:predicted PurR-regulated permease PerM
MAEPKTIKDKPVPPSPGLTAKFMSTVIAAVVVGFLYAAKPVLMPLALAVVVSFALAPLMGVLRRARLGQVPSVLLSLLLIVVVVTGVGTFMGSQLAKLAVELPHYQTNLAHKIQSVIGTARNNDTLTRLNQTVHNLSEQINGPKVEETATPGQATAPMKPIPVEVKKENQTPLDVAQSVLGPLLQPLGVMALVLVFVGFILLQKDDLRDRFVRLAGSRDMQRTTVALSEAATRLSRYLFLQTCINASFGLFVGAGLWLIGIPNAGLWALMAMLFRFVPYVGVPIAFLFPFTLAMAIDPGWSRMVWVMILFGSFEAVTGQVIEPFLYGRSMGLSAVAVVVAAAFWTWLWGPVGLLLSTPLTMCFVVLGRHIESLKFLDVMLGDQPALSAEESFYLRMLADTPDEASDEAEAFLKGNALADYYDEVAARALMLAQNDVNRGVLGPMRQERIRDGIRELIGNLSDRRDEDDIPEPPASWQGEPVLCVAGRGPLDEAAVLLLQDMLDKYGIGARIAAAGQTEAAHIDKLETAGVRLVCVSYLEPGTFKNARYLVRRLRKKMPDAAVIALFWGLTNDPSRYLDSVEATEADIVTTGLSETVRHILAFARRAAPRGEEAPQLAAP